jgi:hypothetical protein
MKVDRQIAAPPCKIDTHGMYMCIYIDLTRRSYWGVCDYYTDYYTDCTITVSSAGTLGACPTFDTESGYDYVNIDGTDYDGTNCPQGSSVEAYSTIYWHTDGSVQTSGWEICLV